MPTDARCVGVAPGEGECPPDIDCAGTWSNCTAACETAEQRVWSESVAQSGWGLDCPHHHGCGAGDGDCACDASDADCLAGSTGFSFSCDPCGFSDGPAHPGCQCRRRRLETILGVALFLISAAALVYWFRRRAKDGDGGDADAAVDAAATSNVANPVQMVFPVQAGQGPGQVVPVQAVVVQTEG